MRGSSLLRMNCSCNHSCIPCAIFRPFLERRHDFIRSLSSFRNVLTSQLNVYRALELPDVWYLSDGYPNDLLEGHSDLPIVHERHCDRGLAHSTHPTPCPSSLPKGGPPILRGCREHLCSGGSAIKSCGHPLSILPSLAPPILHHACPPFQ